MKNSIKQLVNAWELLPCANKLLAKVIQVFFLFFFLKIGRWPFLCSWWTIVLLFGHWHPCFWFLVTSTLGFKGRAGSALFALSGGVHYMFPEIHFWCYMLLTSWWLAFWGTDKVDIFPKYITMWPKTYCCFNQKERVKRDDFLLELKLGICCTVQIWHVCVSCQWWFVELTIRKIQLWNGRPVMDQLLPKTFNII